ncbi:hypothetical protein ACFQ88_24585 [Paenibacillus sp. NPDC056579]|uniref:hypothetical protein n=1 Tax=Paenibacillus sp. NPDC056579 TaxID=3345871 RepID=UPI0036C16F35
MIDKFFISIAYQLVGRLSNGIIVIAPGGFRTEFNKVASLVVAANRISDYLPLYEGIKEFIRNDGNQLGDPEKAAEVFIELVNSPNNDPSSHS